MLARSPERREAVPVDNPLPGSSKGTAQKTKSDLMKTRVPLRRNITWIHGKMIELISKDGSRRLLKKKMLELEESWEKCRKLDKLILEMMGESEGDEAENILEKEKDSQYVYETKVEELLEASEKYLDRRRIEPPSVASSTAGSVIDPDEHIEGRENTHEEENRREIDPLQTHLENGNRTRFSDTLHVPRVPFPSATSTGLRAENTPSTDEWFRRRPASRERGAQAPSNLPPLRLEPFDGDCTRWSKFAAGFKTLIHDVVPNDYQRLEYLRMYLSENVRAEIAGLLSEPSQYQEALHTLSNRYEDRVLLGKAITRKLNELPNVSSGDVKALEVYLLRLNEIIATMHRVKLVGEMFSPSVLEIAMGKLPNEMTEAWGEKIIKKKEELSLASLKEWLDLKRKAFALT